MSLDELDLEVGMGGNQTWFILAQDARGVLRGWFLGTEDPQMAPAGEDTRPGCDADIEET